MRTMLLQILARTAVLLLLGLTMDNAYHWSQGSGNLPRVAPPGACGPVGYDGLALLGR